MFARAGMLSVHVICSTLVAAIASASGRVATTSTLSRRAPIERSAWSGIRNDRSIAVGCPHVLVPSETVGRPYAAGRRRSPPRAPRSPSPARRDVSKTLTRSRTASRTSGPRVPAPSPALGPQPASSWWWSGAVRQHPDRASVTADHRLGRESYRQLRRLQPGPHSRAQRIETGIRGVCGSAAVNRVVRI